MPNAFFDTFCELLWRQRNAVVLAFEELRARDGSEFLLRVLPLGVNDLGRPVELQHRAPESLADFLRVGFERCLRRTSRCGEQIEKLLGRLCGHLVRRAQA